ncbi:MAG TPA: TonB-dependent receptor, partial [Opitutaceae bacterium]
MHTPYPVHRRASAGRFVSTLLLFLLALTVAGLSSPAQAQEPRRPFDLPGDAATKTLKLFSEQSGRALIADTDLVRGVKTNPVRGEFTPEEAAHRMFFGTGLVAAKDEQSGAFTVRRETPDEAKNVASRPVPDRTAAREPPAATSGDGTIELSPFEVNTDRDTGYTAASSLAGGRVELPLKFTPAAVSVLTREFLDDIGGTNLRDVTEWAPNVVPEYNKNEAAFGDFNYFVRGMGSSFPSRNYFLWYVDSDSYNTERFEFSRGPNGVLFGDGNAGGIVTTWTKRPRFDRPAYTVQARADSYGGWRTTIDLNQPLNDRLALRFNGLAQNLESWRDNSDNKRHGAHLAGIVKLTDRTRLRFEGEWGDGERTLYSSMYFDQASYWDGATTYDGSGTPIPNATATAAGLTRMSTVDYNVFIPALPDLGIQNWSTFYKTTGTGAAIRPEGRGDIANLPRLPSREFNNQPVDSLATLDYHTYSGFLEHRFTPDLFIEAAFNVFSQDRWARNEPLYNTYAVDVNRLLPNGQPNPKFGVPFTDVNPIHHFQGSRVTDYRLLANYRFDIERIALEQRLTVIAGTRKDRYSRITRHLRRINTPTPWTTTQGNILRVRMYWDEPGSYLTDPDGIPAPADWDLGYVRGTYVQERKAIDYLQLSTVSSLFDDRLTLLLGGRHDRLYRTQRSNQGAFRDPVTGETLLGAAPDKGQPPVIGGKNVTEVSNTSANAGAVFYPLKWLGVYANWSETFAPPNSGPNLFDGSVPGVSQSTGYDFGLKLDFFDGRLNAVLNYYEVEEVDRLVNGQRTTEINRIWNNLNRPLDVVSARDLETWRGTGWEFEVTANLTRSWRLMANLSFPETEQIDLYPGFRGYVAQHLATWQAGANDPANANRLQIQSDIDAIQSTLGSLAEGRALNNTYDYTVNVYTTYEFRDGPLKGLSVGGGANARGGSVIGNRPGDPFAYVYSQDYYVASAHLAYDHRLTSRVRARYQINVSNL